MMGSTTTRMFEGEDTVRPGQLRSSMEAIDATPRAMTTRRAVASSEPVILPGGLACFAPDDGSVLTVKMDAGFSVHLERDGDEVLVTVELPEDARAPLDDEALAALASQARADATEHHRHDARRGPARAFHRAWGYRRVIEALAQPFADDGGPIIPKTWVTLSWDGRVHVPGIGTFSVVDGGAHYDLEDGRWVEVRRLEAGGDAHGDVGPTGAVEIIVAPALAFV